ncbi:uncharacterized protein VP01_969g6 [Puccinia sorghi]|uniref:Uncharacterized protein n=1 Tax=Puccinia sorghi TaxID=27349 RepID=A0A0L6U844_9BASI|nr:uncharacterized protein VP01_969g6 [Puccinia sorghi]
MAFLCCTKHLNCFILATMKCQGDLIPDSPFQSRGDQNVSHQLRCQSVGINQTRVVYQQVKDENHLLTQDFWQMIFGDVK